MEISVVVPTYNQAALLARCLTALQAQGVPAGTFEVVVVDDGSTDATPELLRRQAAAWPALRVLTQANAGPARSRNRGLSAARGGLIAFTDSDCEPASDWISRVINAFAAHPQATGIEGRVTTDDARVTPFTHQVENPSGGLFCTANVAYRREVLERVGGFDEDFFYGHEDTDLALRVESLGPIVFDPAVHVVHPPVPVSFGKLVRRPTVWTCQVVLFAKHPRRYVDGHGAGPFRVLLKHYGVVQLAQRVWRFRAWAWREPGTYLKFLWAMLLQRIYLLACFPSYMQRFVELTGARPPHARSRIESERAFHDEIYRDVEVRAGEVPELDRFNLHAAAQLDGVRGRRVLDVGCGDGELTVWLALAGATVFALDVSEEALKATARRAAAAGVRDRVHLLAGSFEELPLAAKSVDRVIGSLVLHHVDAASAGREIARVLSIEGRGAFSENFGFNPFLAFARRWLIGRFGIPRLGTETEKPLDGADLARFGERLALELSWPEFLFFQLLDRQVFRYRNATVNRLCIFLDGWVFENLPGFRRYSYRGTVVVQLP